MCRLIQFLYSGSAVKVDFLLFNIFTQSDVRGEKSAGEEFKKSTNILNNLLQSSSGSGQSVCCSEMLRLSCLVEETLVNSENVTIQVDDESWGS